MMLIRRKVANILKVRLCSTHKTCVFIVNPYPIFQVRKLRHRWGSDLPKANKWWCQDDSPSF